MPVTKVAHVALNVTDLEAAVAHYANLLGLTVAERTDGRVYLRGMDEQDHHSLVLQASENAGVDHVALKVNQLDDLETIEKLVERTSTRVTRVAHQEESGQGESIRFVIPSGQTFEVVYHVDKVGFLAGQRDPDPVPDEAYEAMAPVARLDHLLITTPDAEDNTKFFTEVLDFGVSEALRDPSGKLLASWLFCTNTMHDVAMAPGPAGGLHHVAFWVDSRADVVRCATALRKKGVRLFDYGVTRHGVSGGHTVYFYDPAGNRNEIFTNPYFTIPGRGRTRPVEWDLPNFPRGVFYYERELEMSFFEEVT
jgi:catechol 2,3-dioxygenase